MNKPIYYQLKKFSATAAGEHVNVGNIVEVEVNVEARLTVLMEAIKKNSPSHLGNVDVGDMDIWQGERQLDAFNTVSDVGEQTRANPNIVEVRYTEAASGKDHVVSITYVSVCFWSLGLTV